MISGTNPVVAGTRPGRYHSRCHLRGLAHISTAVAILWGALAFGAVYPWAFWPLALLAQVAGLAGLFAAAPNDIRYAASRPAAFSRGFVTALLCVVTAALLQLLPLPLNILSAVNPNGVELLRQWDLAFAANSRAHSLSMVPSASRFALALLGSFIMLLLGTSRVVSLTGPRRLVEMLTAFGVVLALVGIIQKPLYARQIYGFWTPREGGLPFGPFVNKNHFAGWMLMVLPLSLGYLCGAIARGMRHVGPAWRQRVLWLSTPDANKLILTAAAIGIMGLALVLTFSRSGIGALAVSFLMTGWFAVRRLQGRSRKVIVTAYLLLLPLVLVGWVGTAALVSRFEEHDWASLNGRRGASADALDTFGRHWLTGTGLNTYQFANRFYQKHDMAAYTSAAHNDYLQLAAEGGLLLAIPAAICIALFMSDVRRRLREDQGSSAYWIRAGAVTALVAIGLQETVEFSLQIPGNAALFAVVCGIALHTTPERRPR